ncbi:leucine-rich repeat-containing protein 31-like [Amphiura filiformis]|uniref:leucine-rich repeat-containing protein 31-like n=1 Tax=Amphiura filiformis TaxID=82378 RepID=UPI003B22023A
MTPLDCCLEVLVLKTSLSLTTDVLKGLERILPSLQELHLSGCRSIWQLFVLLEEIGQKSLTSSSGQVCVDLPLQCLDLACCDIGDNVRILNRSSQHLPSLKCLLVPNCKLEEKHFQKMSESFSAHPFEMLDLSGNTKVMSMLDETCQYLNILMVLKLVNTGLTDESVAQLPLLKLINLRELDLSNNKLSSEAAVDIANLLRRNCCPLLEHLSLQQNEIESYGACALAQGFKYVPLLKKFFLDKNCRIGACGILEIFQNLKHVSHLEELGLAGIALSVHDCYHIIPLSYGLHYAGVWDDRTCKYILQVVKDGNIQRISQVVADNTGND